MPDLQASLIVAATFLLAGAVKGVIGLGLPTVSLGLLTAAFGLPSAMAMMIVPSLVTNAWQAMVGGHGRMLVRRLWPFLLAATLTIALGARALTRVDLSLLSALLGALIMTYAVVGLAGVRLAIGARAQRWAGPATGMVNGLLTGMTGSFVVPGVAYLQALGLSRDELVQAMGILFTLSTVALGLALGGARLISAEQGLVSTLAVVPALLGMLAGQRIRHRLSESAFRRVFFAALLVLGLYIVFESMLGG